MKNILFIIGALFMIFTSCNNSEKEEKKSDTIVQETSQTADVKIVEKEEEEDKNLLENLLKFNSEEELISEFGKKNVKRAVQWFAEGTVKAELSVLFPETDKEVRFMWGDDTLHHRDLTTIMLSKRNSPWHTKQGIKIGTRMNELVKINEHEFMFGGFDWDYGGYTNFKDGKLFNTGLIITLGWNGETDTSNPAYQKMTGDIEIKTDSKLAKDYNPSVVELQLEKR